MATQPSPTASMAIDILSFLDSKSVLDDCPDLRNINAFVKYLTPQDKDKVKVIAYIVLLYSEDSILNKLTQLSLSERKLKAAELVGFSKSKKTGEYARKIVSDVFELGGEGIVDCIFEYLKYQNNSLWTMICTHEALFDQYTHSIFKEIDIKDDPKKENEALIKKKEMRKEMREISQDLKEFYKEFYRDHKDVKEHESTKRRSIEERARVKR